MSYSGIAAIIHKNRQCLDQYLLVVYFHAAWKLMMLELHIFAIPPAYVIQQLYTAKT
jgi:hypothetical protein